MRIKKNGMLLLMNIMTCIMSLLVIIPMIVILLNSFKTRAEANSMSLSLPKEWAVENYAIVVERGKLFISFFNSLIYATCSVTLIVILVTAAAFVLSRHHSKLNRALYYFMIAGIAMPLNNVALMEVMKITHLVNTRIGIILLYAAINIPLSLFLAYAFINTIPREIDEAGVIDGCTPFMLFIKIILPLLKPVVSTLFILNFMNVWNDFIMPLYFLNNSDKWPMTLAVYNFFGTFEQSWNLVSADIILTLLPVIIVFIAGQKYIVGGISAGAVKG